jgi:hypothetical protein
VRKYKSGYIRLDGSYFEVCTQILRQPQYGIGPSAKSPAVKFSRHRLIACGRRLFNRSFMISNNEMSFALPLWLIFGFRIDSTLIIIVSCSFLRLCACACV